MNLLVSLCNRDLLWDSAWREIYLLRVNGLTGAITPVHLPGGILRSTTGITGIARYPGGYVCVVQPSSLLFLSERLEVREMLRVKELRDGHGIAFHEGRCYVTSTGTDSLLEYSPENGASVIWSANVAGGDSIHLNSVVRHAGGCWVTAFGPKNGGLWSSASDGRILNIASGEQVLSGLRQPHSLVAANETLWVCDSSRMTIRSTRHDSVVVPRGYLRGLAIEGRYIFVGSSVGRKRSKSTGELVDNADDPGRPSGECGISVLIRSDEDGPFQDHSFISLKEFADEIFDIVVVPAAS